MADFAVDEQVYTPHSRYRLMALVSFVLFLLLGWNLLSPWVQGRDWSPNDLDAGLIFFLLVSFGIALWYSRLALSSVEVTLQNVTLKTPLSRSRTVAFRQMTGLSVSDRAGHAITLLYHPFGQDALVDPDEIASLTLPEVDDQDALLADLEGQLPT